MLIGMWLTTAGSIPAHVVLALLTKQPNLLENLDKAIWMSPLTKIVDLHNKGFGVLRIK